MLASLTTSEIIIKIAQLIQILKVSYIDTACTYVCVNVRLGEDGDTQPQK